MSRTKRPIICLDFDGVLHSYRSGWKGVDIIPDNPVDGALFNLLRYAKEFEVAIFSSRSHQQGEKESGIEAMQRWLQNAYMDELEWGRAEAIQFVQNELNWPIHKPSAMWGLDDRVERFRGPGTWPSVEHIKAFKPWNK